MKSATERDRGRIDGDEETNAETEEETSGEAPYMAAMTGEQTKIHSPPDISSKPLKRPTPLHPDPLPLSHSEPPCSPDHYQTISAMGTPSSLTNPISGVQ